MGYYIKLDEYNSDYEYDLYIDRENWEDKDDRRI